MLKYLIFWGTTLLVTASTATADPERRCGWYMNPTPANHWLEDADQIWVLALQGGYQIWNEDGSADIDFSFGDEWVSTNGSPGHSYYGHGCACIDGSFDHDSGYVLSIHKFTTQPLQVCRADPNLPDEPIYFVD